MVAHLPQDPGRATPPDPARINRNTDRTSRRWDRLLSSMGNTPQPALQPWTIVPAWHLPRISRIHQSRVMIITVLRSARRPRALTRSTTTKALATASRPMASNRNTRPITHLRLSNTRRMTRSSTGAQWSCQQRHQTGSCESWHDRSPDPGFLNGYVRFF
jgi:hypothetical protein